jgi:predicted DNA-binding protein
MNMNKNEVVLFRCDYQFKKRLDELVVASGKTKSEFIRECIQESDKNIDRDFEQKLAQINIKPANRSDLDGAFSNLTRALEKVIRVDDIPKEWLVRLEDLILEFQSVRLKEARK